MMRIRRIGKIIMALVTVLLLVLTVACTPAVTEKKGVTTEKEVATATPTVEWGIIEIRVTDPPPADVRSAVVYLQNIEVHKVSDNASNNASDNASGWIPIIGAPPSFDLMDVIGVEQILGSANITAGSFTQIRMDVDRVEVVTVAGDNFTAEVPGDKLRIVGAFNVGGGKATVLTLDFDGEKSLIVTGKGKALFQPVVKLLIKEKEEVTPGKGQQGPSDNVTEEKGASGKEQQGKP